MDVVILVSTLPFRDLKDYTKDNKVIYMYVLYISTNDDKQTNHIFCKIKLSFDCMFVEFETNPAILVKVNNFLSQRGYRCDPNDKYLIFS